MRRAGRTRWPRLAEAFDPSANSLAFLRLVLAGLVLVDHAFPLGGFNHGTDPAWAWTGQQESLGGLAVAGFFVVSGFLVCRSYVESRSVLSYLWKRVLRIFPGFWVCLLVTVAVFAPLAYLHEVGSLHGYLHRGTDTPGHYVAGNALLWMNQYSIDGLLGTNPYPHAWDGSLWTLIYEFKCYLAVGVVGLLGLLRRGRLGVLVLAAGLWGVQLAEKRWPGSVSRHVHLFADPQLVRLSFLFALGAVLYCFADRIPLTAPLAAAALVVFVVGMRADLYAEVGQVAWAYLLFWLAVRLPVRRADRFGDFSYGLYIYAFPVEQLAAEHQLQRWGLPVYVAVTLGVSLALAAASWHLVEHPCLRLKRLRLRAPLRGRPRPERADPRPARSG